MSDQKTNCSHHRDLYLEILKKAEKEADLALIQMISKKLKGSLSPPESTRDGCQVFSFPMMATSNIDTHSGEDLFWKNSQFWQDLVQFMAILGTAAGWFIFFCQLITYRIVS